MDITSSPNAGAAAQGGFLEPLTPPEEPSTGPFRTRVLQTSGCSPAAAGRCRFLTAPKSVRGSHWSLGRHSKCWWKREWDGQKRHAPMHKLVLVSTCMELRHAMDALRNCTYKTSNITELTATQEVQAEAAPGVCQHRALLTYPNSS